jgi:MoaA/NifB/PqqE/SkfB family radical SAM enzyme
MNEEGPFDLASRPRPVFPEKGAGFRARPAICPEFPGRCTKVERPLMTTGAVRIRTERRVGEGAIPRLPLAGSLDLTYRCNNACRHCWLRLSAEDRKKKDELSFDEIRRIVGEARALGCRDWSLSGGEPMLRPDFAEIFAYIARASRSYSLNTNGTLITPAIARLMKREGQKMVAIYGATAAVHDHVTRVAGSFEAAMRGFAYLKEAGAGFAVQVVPMRGNRHELDEMLKLARSLSPLHRIGAAWLWLSADRRPKRYAEIAGQRLDPKCVIELDPPALGDEAGALAETGPPCTPGDRDDRLFAGCISARRDFHVDSYGGLSFCAFVKDPALRYDLRKGGFAAGWDVFIPSLGNKVRGGDEYRNNCGSCERRGDCRWCPVYGYLEHGRYSAPVEYLCSVARESRRFKEDWAKTHRRHYRIAGITIQVESDLPISDTTFDPKFRLFRADGPGGDTISVRHHFGLPDLAGRELGQVVYRKPPWVIRRNGRSWIYSAVSPHSGPGRPEQWIVFNDGHTRGRVYHADAAAFRGGRLGSLTLFPTDQILLARLLADRQGCYLHSAGAILKGKGLLFVGHSEAGKSTIVEMLKGRAEILCDDRNIARRWPEGFRLHGTWSHGDVPLVSPSSAPLSALLFLRKADGNRLHPLRDRKTILARLLACLIKPYADADWWGKTLTVVENLIREIPAYDMEFDKSGKAVDLLRDLVE